MIDPKELIAGAPPPMRRSYIEGTMPPEFRPDPNGPYILWDDAAAAISLNAAELVTLRRQNGDLIAALKLSGPPPTADYIERTAPPADGLPRYDMQVDDDGHVRAPMCEDGGWVRYVDAAAAIASARAVPPADGLPEFETTAEERAKLAAIASAAAAAWADTTLKTIDRLDQTIIRVDGEVLHRFIRDFDRKAALAAANERAAAPPAGLPEFETTAEERAQYSALAVRAAEAWANKTLSITDRFARTAFMVDGDFLHRLFRDLDKAIAFAASETKRADGAEAVYRAEFDGIWAALGILTEEDFRNRGRLSYRVNALRAERDREAAARREADERWRANMQNAWSAIAMIREAVEEFGPVAALESEDAVLLRGPEPVHAAEAIIDALGRVREHAEQAEERASV